MRQIIDRTSPGANEGSPQPQAARSNLLEVEGPRHAASLAKKNRAEAELESAMLAVELAEHDLVGKETSARRQPPEEIQQHDLDRIGSELVSDLPALHPTQTGNKAYRTMPFQVLSWYPRIVLFPKFLDYDKCDHVIEIGKSKMHQSGLVLRKGETTEGTKDIRTRCRPGQTPLRSGFVLILNFALGQWESLPPPPPPPLAGALRPCSFSFDLDQLQFASPHGEPVLRRPRSRTQWAAV